MAYAEGECLAPFALPLLARSCLPLGACPFLPCTLHCCLDCWGTAQHSTAQHSTAQHSVAQHSRLGRMLQQARLACDGPAMTSGDPRPPRPPVVQLLPACTSWLSSLRRSGASWRCCCWEPLPPASWWSVWRWAGSRCCASPRRACIWICWRSRLTLAVSGVWLMGGRHCWCGVVWCGVVWCGVCAVL